MPYKSQTIPINNENLDRRVKLTKAQKDEIRQLFADHAERAKKNILGEAVSQRIVAKKYGVSRRTIVFVLYPERYKANHALRKEKDKLYYDKKRHAKYTREHRRYKQDLFQRGLLRGTSLA